MIDDARWPRGRPIELRGVTLRRGGSEILRGVDLAFEAGTRYVLVGASGSGKTSLLRLLNRLDDPDSGEITLGGSPLKGLPIRLVRDGIGLVFQAPRPLPGTLRDNLLYPHLVRGRAGPDDSDLADWLVEVGLDPAGLDRDAANLSGGERQRLAIAVALGCRPEVLALDEPTSALDPASSRKVIDALDRRAAEDGLRTIIVTHSREQAARLGAVAIRLDAGRVVDQGATGDVLDRADASVWAESTPIPSPALAAEGTPS